MTPLSPTAEAQIDALTRHYERLSRPEALRNLALAVVAGQVKARGKPLTGLPAPRPYPQLAKAGERWIKERAYWIHYQLEPRLILGVYYETLDIPSHVPMG